MESAGSQKINYKDYFWTTKVISGQNIIKSQVKVKITVRFTLQFG